MQCEVVVHVLLILYTQHLVWNAGTQKMQKPAKASPMSITHLTLNNYFDQTPYLGGTWSHKISFQW